MNGFVGARADVNRAAGIAQGVEDTTAVKNAMKVQVAAGLDAAPYKLRTPRHAIPGHSLTSTRKPQ